MQFVKRLLEAIAKGEANDIEVNGVRQYYNVLDASKEAKLYLSAWNKLVKPKKPIPSGLKEAANHVITELNVICGKSFRLVDGNRKQIMARLQDGFTPQHLIDIIHIMSSHWLEDPKMNQYLRPSTLFSKSKSEGYLNTKPYVKPNTNQIYSADRAAKLADGFDEIDQRKDQDTTRANRSFNQPSF